MTPPSSSSDADARTWDVKFRVFADTPGGSALDDVFAEFRAEYIAWMSRAPELDPEHCRVMLGRHMPELLGLFDNLLERLGGGDEVARFLSLYCPPPLVRGCTQLVLDDDSGPVLLRSYDHHPDLFDAVVLRSDWDGVATLAVSDCIWGALDGVNEHGLAIALAFGGRNAVGEGFGAPLLCRYVLQTCATVAEARAALSRVLVYMPYTFVVVDADGDFVTAFLRPDRDPSFVSRRASANHQGAVEWERYAKFNQSEARLARAESLVGAPGSVAEARRAFLEPPLWRTDYAKGSGTLYVAEYAATDRTLTLHWPGRSEHSRLADPAERTFSVELSEHPVTRGA